MKREETSKTFEIPYSLRKDMELSNLEQILEKGELRLSTVDVYAFYNILLDYSIYPEETLGANEFQSIFVTIRGFYRSIGSDGGKYFYIYKEDTENFKYYALLY